ncbi:Adenylyltransferase and sulfurtransferase MOCS3 (Includes: Adenylyltransferase MOCS3; Sulfurtransferase MOCS3) [Nostocoides japonicum T1-X7]|uniref:Adenylyltransferase and sulfurtransferase MOCS3 n=1 Tax=Nostocoides japonicum T1-X7 TaxID=1194083 RepID=A0A077LZD4_9MICO|nr:ThiF family adenylyltransferase [Tetrasphaera japonica]CCH77350.1 Adenylyltransferase and sulfurtransferase MOCS3 (Includes: Adenylyltransferase MOCS3; Sulfurtransferase MOCS3) [Tetrasphaera japonica T1-X7]
MPWPPLVDPGPPLAPHERHRYARHLTLAALGETAQRRLRAARVLVVGAGGLGSPALLYLAAAGVGTIGVADDDVVDATNLQRQVVHRESAVGRPKTASAAHTLTALNSGVRVVEHRERLRADNAAAVVAGYDVVVDGADSFATRYLVNDACVLAGIPDVWGSVLAFDGQVSVWWAGHGPCYRCVFPDPPPVGSVASCADAGVLGSVCALVASQQVTEVVKLLTGVGEPLVGRIAVHDALAGTSGVVPVARDPRCPLCGAAPTMTTLTDLEEACRPGEAAPLVSPADLAALLASAEPPVVLDVREDSERAESSIAGSVHLPLGALRTGGYAGVLDPARPVVVHCAVGRRSAVAARVLADAGYAVQDLAGGILAWQEEGLPVERGVREAGTPAAAREAGPPAAREADPPVAREGGTPGDPPRQRADRHTADSRP